MFLIAQEAMHPSKGVGIGMHASAGLALACSNSLWFPYVLAVSVAILLPFASGTPDKARFRVSVGTLFFFARVPAWHTPQFLFISEY